MIETKKINFYDDHTDSNELFIHENISMFPPRFCLHVRNIEQEHTTDLVANINVTLYDSPEERKPLKVIKYKLLNQVSTTTNDPRCILIKNSLPSLGNHCCDTNKPDFRVLMQFLNKLYSSGRRLLLI